MPEVDAPVVDAPLDALVDVLPVAPPLPVDEVVPAPVPEAVEEEDVSVAGSSSPHATIRTRLAVAARRMEERRSVKELEYFIARGYRARRDRGTMHRPEDPVNVCYKSGWVVGPRAVPGDPSEHDVSGLPIHGCNNLACVRCKRAVRTARRPIDVVDLKGQPRWIYEEMPAWTEDANAKLRVYACHCHLHLEAREDSIHHDYAYDDDLIGWKTDWSCAGHPLVDLPRFFDGILVTADNVEGIVAEAVAGRLPGGLRDPVDDDPRLWPARLATRLDGTPHQERVIAAAARHLTRDDLATRVRAVHFFADTVRFVAAMHPARLLGEHRALFAGVANPYSTLRTTRTLEHLLWDICGQTMKADEALREVARAAALDATRSCRALFFALGRHDAAWLVDNAVRVARAHHGAQREDFLGVLRATGLQTASEAIARDGRPPASVLEVLREARALLADPANDFTWSSWEGCEDAVAELDRHIVALERGEPPPGSLASLFLPTGPMQEVALSSGWGDAFIDLANRYDEAAAVRDG